MIIDNVAIIKARIAAACARANRDPAEVTLVAVTKGRPVEDILQVLKAGIRDIGENRIQEAAEKYDIIARLYEGPLRWHMIGHVQTNKARDAVRMFDCIHSVDSVRHAQEIDKQASRINKIQDILIEVKTSPEATKSGIGPDALNGMIDALGSCNNIRVLGLMTMGPVGDLRGARGSFHTLKALMSTMCSQLPTPNSQLSMGMSDDFEIAIEEGATMVRIGRALFENI